MKVGHTEYADSRTTAAAEPSQEVWGTQSTQILEYLRMPLPLAVLPPQILKLTAAVEEALVLHHSNVQKPCSTFY